MLAFAVAPPLSQPGASACVAPHDHYPFCDQTKPLDERVSDLLSRIREEDVPNLLTARGHLGRQQSLPYIGVPSFYWGHNCMVSTSFKTCVNDRCKTTFPSGPSIAATMTVCTSSRIVMYGSTVPDKSSQIAATREGSTAGRVSSSVAFSSAVATNNIAAACKKSAEL